MRSSPSGRAPCVGFERRQHLVARSRPGQVVALRALAPQGIDIVLDHQGTETIETALELGVPRERINTISGYDTRYAVRYVGRKGMNRELVEQLADDLVSGRLRMRVEAEYPLARIVDAYRRLETGHLAGKVVLTIP